MKFFKFGLISIILNLTSFFLGTVHKIDVATAAATLQMNLPEDMRISKLMRRLCGEKNSTQALDLCEKLKIVIFDASNALYIRRSFDILSESIVQVLKDGPDECVDVVAELFGMIGFIIRAEFNLYRNWIVRCYKITSLRVPMMRALLKTLELDMAMGKQDLRENSQRIMDLLKDFLENAEETQLFIAITKTIKQFSLIYPKTFEPHFTDIVDIVVGWHLETDQSVELKQHCSNILQNFKKFW